MDPPENSRVQACLQLVQCPVVRRSGHGIGHYHYTLVHQRGMDHLIGLDEEEPLAGSNGELIAPAALPRLDRRDHPLEILRRNDISIGELVSQYDHHFG